MTPATPLRVNAEAALSLRNVISGVGALTILHDVTLDVGAGEVTVVLGANGAGKTTLLRTVAGILTPRAGQIRLFGESIEGRPAHLITRSGIGHVPSGRELFPRLSVADHIELGGRVCRPERRAELRERTLALFPALSQRLRQQAGTLSGGEQQMVAIARALMTDPRVLLLDEPSTGLAPKIVLSVFETLPKLLEQGMSVLLVEQSLNLALAIANRAYVIDNGRIILSGTPAELAADPRVIQAYLGT